MKIPIDILFENCKKAVRKEIRKDCWKEAYEILELCDETDRQDFIKYHNEDKGNICCLVLDFAKKKLVGTGKMEQKEGDHFKDAYIWLDGESNNKKK
jgi:predicted nucleic acid-binding protein